jgi:hypothetical protein
MEAAVGTAVLLCPCSLVGGSMRPRGTSCRRGPVGRPREGRSSVEGGRTTTETLCTPRPLPVPTALQPKRTRERLF